MRALPMRSCCSVYAEVMSNMDLLAGCLGALALSLLFVTFQARRLGNQQSDIALLGASAGLSGAGALAAFLM